MGRWLMIASRQKVFRAAMAGGALWSAGMLQAEVFLPGSQPDAGKYRIAPVKQCRRCHSGTPSGEADPYFSWQGGMMSQAARDPVFRAALAVANQDVAGVGEYCLRCHTPSAWIQGRSSLPDGSALTEDDLHGVSCAVCHSLVDPMSEEGRGMVESAPPGYGNSMLVIDSRKTMRGPYEDAEGPRSHSIQHSPYHASSELCANCHNVSNPLQAEDVTTQPPHAYGHIERTYSEWALSAFAQEGSKGTCQSCHYPPVEGGGVAANKRAPHRDYFVPHGPAGGSAWVQDAILALWPDQEPAREALEASKKRAVAMLRSAAELSLKQDDDSLVVRVTNLTGHKLPTGYPEGRRMWIQARFFGKEGELLSEIGAYTNVVSTLNGEEVQVPTLLHPEKTKVYECLPGISPEQAARTGKPAGPSFHFVLNDVTVKDNRIPPRGFSNAAFAVHHCEPVGAVYADGQHWDDTVLAVPDGAATAQVKLLYQSVSWEYIRFLAEENSSDEWGAKLYKAWTKTGCCPPVTAAEAKADLLE